MSKFGPFKLSQLHFISFIFYHKNTTSVLTFCLAFLISSLIVLKLCIGVYYAWPFTTDDAYISWKYALYLSEGEGFRWYPNGQTVEGYSNFLWIIVALFFIKVGWPLAVSVKAFSCVCLVMSLFFLYKLSRCFLNPLLSLLPVYLFIQYKGVVWWSVSGLETIFFIALVLFISWQCALMCSNHENKQWVYKRFHWGLACFSLLILALTRFDGVVWCAVVFIYLACVVWQRKLLFLKKNWIDYSIIFLSVFLVPYVLYLIWRVHYFGQWIPNSYHCKALVDVEPFYLTQFYLMLAFPCLILSLPYLLFKNDCRTVLLWFPSLLYALLLWKAHPVIAYYNRLFLGSYAVFVILPVVGVNEFLKHLNASRFNNQLLTTLFIVLFSTLLIPSASIEDLKAGVFHYRKRMDMRLDVARFLNQHTNLDDRVLLGDNGIIPFYSKNNIRFIDTECLNNPDMTKPLFRRSLKDYAQHLKTFVKPEWVVESCYPKWGKCSRLNEQLRRIAFYQDYQLVKQYQSHEYKYEGHQLAAGRVDYVYFIYKRK